MTPFPNADPQSLRGFLNMVRDQHPDHFLRVSEPIETRYQSTSIVFELDRAGRSPVVMFDDIGGKGMPCVTNIAASRKLLAECLSTTEADLPTVFREGSQRYIPCETVDRGAWDEIVFEGEDVDLTRLPIPHQFTVDAAPLHHGRPDHRARPEDRGRHDRLPPPDAEGQEPARRVAAFAPPHARVPPPRRGDGPVAAGRDHARRPPAALHGLDDLCLSAPCAEVRDHRRAVRRALPAGALRRAGPRGPRRRRDRHRGRDPRRRPRAGRPVRRVTGYPSEFTGYASYRSTQNVFVAHRVRMRRDAIFHSVVAGMSKDHILISCITREGEILNALKRNIPNVQAVHVHVPHSTCGAFMAVISLKKIAEGEPQMAAMAALSTELYTKYVIVVDDDVDIFDMNDVFWAIATRVRAEKDIFFVPGCKGAILDPSSDPENFTLTKMGIDATRPTGRDFAERLVISEEERAKARAILERAGVKIG
ncbi:UbiD family decarboxylase [Chenggangzhangella methanolivorans]|uniref:UbiD family decarboxylase n=2 Tax=Chenggangzhangella methanolivorans TaxID=1437009 RepID=A0A9E6UP27_9HYPH|nr:UbiD family decarboxylase [Chenggangzhangella methanolivorans]